MNQSGVSVRSYLATIVATIMATGLITGAALASEADRFAAVEVTAQHVRGSVHMLTGAGGNIGLSVGNDGTLLIDDQYGPLAERIQNAVNESGGATPMICRIKQASQKAKTSRLKPITTRNCLSMSRGG